MIKKVFLSLLATSILIIGGLAYMVHEIIAFTPNTLEKISTWKSSIDPADFKLTPEEIEFNTAEFSDSGMGKTLTLRGWFFPGINQDSPTIITLHGKGGRREGMVRFIALFNRMGFNVLAYDQRHHGESDGTYTSYGYFESYDVKTAIDFLASKNINTKQLGILGESMGAATAIMAAGIEPRIKFLIEDSGFAELNSVIKDNAWRMNYVPRYPFPDIAMRIAGKIAGFDTDKASPVTLIKKVEQPTMFFHCTPDEWVDPKYMQPLYEASAAKVKVKRMFQDCEHTAGYDAYTKEYTAMVHAFFNENFPNYHIDINKTDIDKVELEKKI